MTYVFICRECSKGQPNGVCAYINRSTAFPINIIGHLKCPMSHRHYNWEYVRTVSLHIPVNFKAEFSQKSLKKEEEASNQ